ncbi:ATP-binding protein [Vibrio jasicida]|uniref:ATP-binding protein n=1 Tax=Vibrio jasicida TaxID=766224 RepID=UPI001E3FC7C1|nr:ATP-binding protein [Vibrio jasicida]
MIALTSGSHVLLHTIGLSEQDKIPGGRLISIKKMDQSIKPIEQLKWRIIKFALLGTLITLVIVYFLFTVGFKPLNTLQVELSEIKAGKRTRLNDQYPEDLQSITRAFNELMFQQQENEQRYRRALNDLAHSLKTRVAVSQALLDDIEEGKIHDINQQLLEMDDVIQGQLKRASLGVKGIVENATPIKPILNSLLLMFDKVNMDKGIHVEQFINNDQTLPMSKADVMEVFGNILENAYRYAERRIDVFINNTEEGIIITFNNDGPAVDESISETLFKRGVRADEKNPGTGLGLALCDEIVHSYKGAIWFETPTDPSMGASLKVLLPYR